MSANTGITGISSITDRIVYVRHATERDATVLKRKLRKSQRGLIDVPLSRILVATLGDEIIGFGVLESAGKGAYAVVKEFGRHRGVRRVIEGHLLEKDSVSRVA